MLHRTGKELDNLTGFEQANPVLASQSQLGPGVRARQDNLGIEDDDPRWSEREERGARRRFRRPAEPEPDIDLGADASDFQGQPTDPFEVLIKRRQKGREHGDDRPASSRFETGLSTVDPVLGELGRRLYMIDGPPELARALLHQIACHVAGTHPVVYVAAVGNPRDLVLKALSRLTGSATPGDLARARDVAERFKPIRERLQVFSAQDVPGPAQLRARLQAAIRQLRARAGLLAIDDLPVLAQGVSRTVPPPRLAFKGPDAARPDPALLEPWIAGLTGLARDLDVPVLAVGPAVEGQACLRLCAPPRSGGPVELDLQAARVRPTRGSRQAPLVVPLAFDAGRSSFEPA